MSEVGPLVTPTASQREPWSDLAVLRALAFSLTIGGLLLLSAAGQLMLYPLPPTLNTAFGVLVGLGLGIALTATGLLYYNAVREHATARVGPEGLSVCNSPETGAPEWIKLEDIESVALRAWPLSPWIKSHRYYELELKVREGRLQVDDTFLVHVHPDFGEFVKHLRGALGERLQLEGVA